MDQYTRRIMGFGVHAGAVDGVALCRMFNHAIRWQRWMPKYLSSDHDPLYRFERWQANLRILEVSEIKTVPYVPLSHPFVERLVGTIRREYLDRMLFWTTADLEDKLLDFRTYFNRHRSHTALEGRTSIMPVSAISIRAGESASTSFGLPPSPESGEPGRFLPRGRSSDWQLASNRPDLVRNMQHWLFGYASLRHPGVYLRSNWDSP